MKNVLIYIMKKLKFDNFKIAKLTNLHHIKGGNGGDDTTGKRICTNGSRKWTVIKKDLPITPD